MDRKLYLLSEESNQWDTPTKAKYLYLSELNKKLVLYLESGNETFFYISINYGVIHPEEEIEPYKIKKLGYDSLKLWSVCTSQLIERYAKEHEFGTICTLYSGEIYSFMEKFLVRSFRLETPMKYFLTNDMKMKWVYNAIIERINNRLAKK